MAFGVTRCGRQHTKLHSGPCGSSKAATLGRRLKRSVPQASVRASVSRDKSMAFVVNTLAICAKILHYTAVPSDSGPCGKTGKPAALLCFLGFSWATDPGLGGIQQQRDGHLSSWQALQPYGTWQASNWVLPYIGTAHAAGSWRRNCAVRILVPHIG